MRQEDLRALLETDPTIEAEKETGKFYKEDLETARLSMALGMLHGARKEVVLESMNDSHYNTDFETQLDVFQDLGFEIILRLGFDGSNRDPGEPPAKESEVYLWHPDGVLGYCESYMETMRNKAEIYYNYRHPDGRPPRFLTSSGGMQGDIWVGHHDVREGLRHAFLSLASEGEFMTPWCGYMGLYLLNYTEWKRVEDRKTTEITNAKVHRFPRHVREAILPGIKRGHPRG